MFCYCGLFKRQNGKSSELDGTMTPRVSFFDYLFPFLPLSYSFSLFPHTSRQLLAQKRREMKDDNKGYTNDD